MKNKSINIKNLIIKMLLAIVLLFVMQSANANVKDSLIKEYAGRLAHKLDSLIAFNTKNDAAGESRFNNYILRLTERLEDADDSTGFLRQPERNFGAGNISFLNNEVNDLKMQGYEAQLNAINAACSTHKAYLVLIGTILVEVDNAIDETQWKTVNEFFDSRGRNVSDLEASYREKLSERRAFYQKVLTNVRQSIRRTDNNPLSIYNIYSYRLSLKKYNQFKIFSYLHTDCYGNFENKEIYTSFVRTNWKKFNWKSSFRSDFVESAIAMIKKNNEDYKNMGSFFSSGLNGKLDAVYNCMLDKKPLLDVVQKGCFLENNLNELLIVLNEAAYTKLTIEQRLKLLKILTYSNSITNDYEKALLYTIKTTPENDVPALFDALRAVNPIRSDGGVTLYGVFRALEDEDDTYVVGGLQPGNDNNTLSDCMLALRNLHIKLPDAKKEVMLTDFAANINNRCFVWDYNFSSKRLLQGLWGAGSMAYDVVFNKNGSITVTRKEIIGYNWFTLEGPTRDNPLPGVFPPKFGQPETYTINDPLGVIAFTNRSDLGISIPVEKTAAGEDNLVKSLPAIYLAYANNKKLNKANEDKIGIALTALNLLVPYTRLLTILRTGTVMQRVFAFSQLTSSAGSGLRLANYAAPLQNDTVFNKIITCMELGGIINIFNIKSGTNVVKNIASVESAEEKIGKFIAAVESDPVAYNKLIQMIKNSNGTFTAEQKAAAEMILSVKNELKFKGEDVFGSRFYTKYYGTGINNLMYNKPIAKAFEATGLFSVEVVNETQGLFKVSSKTGGGLLAEVTDGTGVVQLKENTVLANGLTEAEMVKVKYKKPGSANIEEELLLGTQKADGTSCLIAGYCFVTGTPVATPGSYKNIELIKEGDLVATKDMLTGKNIIQRVSVVTKKITSKLVRLIAGNDTVITTPEHPFYEETKGWTLAENLAKGIKLLTLAGTLVTVADVQAFDSTATVFNFEVPQTHNYFVGKSQLLAHNTDVCNALVGKMAVKLGTGYAEMEAVIKDIATQYKQLSKLPEEAALAKLEQLCSRAIEKEQLQALLSKVKNSTVFKEQFVGDIVKYSGLLDDFAKNGDLLGNYVAVKTNDYSSFMKLGGTYKTAYPIFANFINSGIRQIWNGFGNIFKAKIEEVAAAANRIKNHRLTVPNGGNYGYLEGAVNNTIIDNKFWRSVSIADAQNEIHIFDAIYSQGSGSNSWLRITDSEYRMINKLASDLGAVKGGKYPVIRGELKIISELPYCTSCQGVIQQFNEMFPNIKLILVDGAK
jgi:Pretoxin HINT domain/The  BURPS668_1122 family of deaminases